LWPFAATAVIAVVTVASLVIVGLSPHRDDVEGFAGLAISVAGIAATWIAWVWRHQSSQGGEAASGPELDRLTDLLAGAVDEEWTRAAGERGLLEPEPIPVRWRRPAASLTGPVEAAVASKRFAPLYGLAAAGESRLQAGDINELHELYGGLGSGRLVIVGGPGSGKSSAAVLLIRAALSYRHSVPDKVRPRVPVPVMFTLQGWNPAAQRVQDWLAERLWQTYPLFAGKRGAGAARGMLAGGRIAVILDGLDEVPEELRPTVLRALSQQAAFRLVLLSRSAEMADASARDMLQGAAAVELQDIDAGTGAEYLTRTQLDPPPQGWHELISQLRQEPCSPLAQALDNPLMLTLLHDTYRATDNAGELLGLHDANGRLASSDDITDHLLDRVLPAAYAPQPGEPAPRYDLATAERALRRIAARMNNKGVRDLQWWNVPDWVDAAPRVIVTWLIAGLVPLLVAGSVLGFGPGIALGLVSGIGAGIAYGRGKKIPKQMAPVRWRQFFRRGPLLVAFLAEIVTALVFVPAALSGPRGTALGLVACLVVGLMAWLGAGLVAGTSRPGTDNISPLSPSSSWRSDRAFGLVVGLGVWIGLGLGVGLASGLAFGLAALGPWIAYGLAPAIGAGIAYPQSWSSSLAFTQLAAQDRTPVRLMRFLEDARRRRVLRTVGPVYQFRHARLQDRLAAQEQPSGASALASTQLGPALATGSAGQPAEDGSVPAGRGVFALPARSSFRLTLLIAAVVASSFYVYELIYTAAPRGPALVSLIRTCEARALARQSSELVTYASAVHQASACYSGPARAEAWSGLLGVGILVAVAWIMFLATPWWCRRRWHMSELAGDSAAGLISRLEKLRQQAGIGPVVWLLQAPSARVSAFVFGGPRRRFVAISGGAAVTRPADFDAVILHGLAHIKNRDIDQTYLALAIWRAFVVAALLPVAVLLIFTGDLADWPRALWRVVLLALIVYSFRNAVLRSRELDADARTRELDPESRLGKLLAALPARTGRRAWHLGRAHPSGQERAAALLDPAPLYRCGFWDGLAVGLVAAIGATCLQTVVALMTTTFGVSLFVPAIIFGAFAGAALAVAMWRNQLRETDPGAVKGWAAGSGLGLGLAAGPIIALPHGFGPALSLAPDQWSLAAVGVLAVWTGLAVVVFMPFPVWIGYWADAWQQGADTTAPRVPARGGMVAAAVAAWVVMTIGLYLLLLNDTWIQAGSSAAAVWHQLPQLLRDMGFEITNQLPGHQVLWSSPTQLLRNVGPLITAQSAGEPGGWVVCLVIVGMPLAAAIAYRQRPRSGEAQDTTLRRRRLAATAWLGLGGCLAAVALTLAVSAVTHAHIAERVRWSSEFVIRLIYFDEQAIVVVAVACALIAAARARSPQGVAISVAVGAAVAAAGAIVLSDAGNIARCFGSLSIQYAHPPAAGSCITTPDSAMLRQTVLGAALVSIVFVPAAHAGGMRLARRVRREHLPAGAKALGWLAAVVAVSAAAASAVLWGPSASAHGVDSGGSIGSDGWIGGYDYKIRIVPDWYDIGSDGHAGLQIVSFPLDGAQIDVYAVLATPAVVADDRSDLRRLGARQAALDGTAGLLLARPGLAHDVLEQWFVVRGRAFYLVTLYGSPEWPGDAPYLENAYSRVLRTWRWTS
jgi:Zn-dependent protease with chaperone function